MIKDYEERKIKPINGWLMLIVTILLIVAFIACAILGFIFGINSDDTASPLIILAIVGILGVFVSCILFAGLCIVDPNEAIVLVFFGKYLYTVDKEGFHFVNPLAKKSKISMKARTLVNEKQKVNDERGNPVEIGVVVIWQVANTASAMFKVEDYFRYIMTQADSAIRNVARQYPYDVSEGEEEMSLRGSSQEISAQLQKELQERVEIAGLEILEARISHLAYAPEIAAAMLQRQQAEAIVQARQKIVEGAVGMVEMALSMLDDKSIVELDAEHKAQMVSNLLVVLCGNKDAQPVVNSGNI